MSFPLAARRPALTAIRARAAEEARAADDGDTESYDGRRRMVAHSAKTFAKVQVLSQFTFSVWAAEKTSIDVRLRAYKGGAAERIVRMTKPVNLDQWVERAAREFGLEHCALRDPDTDGMLMSDSAVKILLLDFASGELARKLDVITVWTERALGRLLDAHHAAQRQRGAHEVWELACRAENHSVLHEFGELFASLYRLLRETDVALRATAAAALFALAEVPSTLERIPTADVTVELLHAATHKANQIADGAHVVCMIGALNRFVGTDEGGAAFIRAGGMRACLPLTQMPQAEVRRAAIVLLGTCLDMPTLPLGALLELCQHAAGLVALSTGHDDALPVRASASLLLAHAIRRVSLAPPASLPQSLRELFVGQAAAVIRGIEDASAALDEANEAAKASTSAEALCEALLEGTCGVLWSMSACLAQLRSPLELDERAMPLLLRLALSPAHATIGLISAGILALVKPSDALALAASDDGVCVRLLALLQHLVQRTRLGRRHELLGAAFATWCALPVEHNRLQAGGHLEQLLALCAALHDNSIAAGRPALKGVALALHISLGHGAMQLCAGDALSEQRDGATPTPRIFGLALQLLASSRFGALYGTACFFGLVRTASAGPNAQAVLDMAGDVGVVEELAAAFRRAVESGRAASPSNWEHTIAHFASATLWLLTHDEANATRLTRTSTELLVQIASSQLGTSAQVQTMCVGVLTRLMCVHYLTRALLDGGAGGVLARIGEDAGKAGTQRLLAASALNEVSQRDEFRGELADATDAVMVSLVNARADEGSAREDMQLIACRSLARVSFGNRKRRLLELGATRELIKLVKAGGTSVQLLELALNALLNLSGEEKNQLLIARQLIFHLAALLYRPPSDACGAHVSSALSNLALNQANRSLMYRAELILKHALWVGLDEIDPDAAMDGRTRGAHGSADADGEWAEYDELPRARAKPRAAPLGTQAKRRYLHWIDAVLGSDAPANVGAYPPKQGSHLAPDDGGGNAEERSTPTGPERLPTAGGRRLAGEKSLPQLMCKPFHESWRLAGEQRAAHAHNSPPSKGTALASASLPILPPLGARPQTAALGTGVGVSRAGSTRPSTAAQPTAPLDAYGDAGEDDGAPAANEDEGADAAAAEHVGIGDSASADVLALEGEAATAGSGVALPARNVPGNEHGFGSQRTGGLTPLPPAACTSAATGHSRAKSSAHAQLPHSLTSNSMLLGVDEAELAYAHERWFPPVVDVDMPKQAAAASMGSDVETRARFLRVKGKAERPFTIRLDPSREYASKWRFDPIGIGALGLSVPGPDDPLPAHEADSSKASMIAWRGRKGCRYSQGLFAQIPLPNGELAHVYYLGHKKNAVNPGPAPGPPVPSALSDFGIEALPPKPHSHPPSARDPPIAKVFLSLSCPLPDEHLLPVEDPSVWFGTAPNQLPLLDVEPRALLNLSMAEPKRQSTIKSWTVDDSLFAPRKKYTDAHSYWNSSKTTQRAFDIDWTRLNQERFRVLIDREDDIGGDDEMREVRSVLLEHRELVYSTFMWYATTEQAIDGHVMNKIAFTRMVADCKLADRESPYCKKEDLDKLFIVQNVEEGAEHKRAANEVNPNRALLRFELFQLLVRIAIEKFVRPAIVTDVSEATEKLILEFIEPNVPAGAKIDTDTFRNAKLYTKPCDDTLRRYLPSLKNIYKFFSAVMDDVGMRNEVLSAQEWIKFCQRASLIDESFKIREAHLCWAWSQMFVRACARARASARAADPSARAPC